MEKKKLDMKIKIVLGIIIFIVVLFKAEDFEDRVLQRIRENIKVDK